MISALHLPVEQLAQFRQNQEKSNSCAIFSACEALNLLYGTDIRGEHWQKRIDHLPYPILLYLRLWKNGPTLPIQQVHQIRWIARMTGLTGLKVEFKSSNRTELIHILTSENSVALVTLGWVLTPGARITLGNSAANYNASDSRFGFHTLLLAAYDPGHVSEDGILRPWGFVNTWTNQNTELFWISEVEFIHQWAVFSFIPFNYLVVLIRKHH